MTAHCPRSVGALAIAETGLDRIGSDARLCFAFLRHSGPQRMTQHPGYYAKLFSALLPIQGLAVRLDLIRTAGFAMREAP